MGDVEGRAGGEELIRPLREAFTDALVRGDAVAAELTVRDAIDAGVDEPSIDDQVVAPALRRIGDMWERGELTVADEHLATHISLRVLALQRETFRVQRRRAAQRVMLAAVEGEQHVVGLEMAGGLLANAGYDVRLLGPDVPCESLGAIVRRHRPDVFGFTVTMHWSGELLALAIDEVRRASPSLCVVVGGAGVPAGVREGDWLALAPQVSRVVETVDALVRRPALN